MANNGFNDLQFAVDLITEGDDERGAALRQVILDNHLEDDGENEKYQDYNSQNPGCNADHPFVINSAEAYYVRLEKELLEYLFDFSLLRGMEYRMKRQSLHSVNDRMLDCLVFEVFSDFDTVHDEAYWFDITAGFHSIF